MVSQSYSLSRESTDSYGKLIRQYMQKLSGRGYYQEILRLSSIDPESRYGLRERTDSYGKLVRQHVQKLSGRQTINTAAESAHCKFIQHYYTSITTPVCIPH